LSEIWKAESPKNQSQKNHLKPAFDKAIRERGDLLNDALENRFTRAKSLFQQGLISAAAEETQALIGILPQAPGAHLLMGSIYQSQMHLEAAEACCRTALRLQPLFLEAQHNLANCLRLQGRLEEAVSAYQACLEITPDLPSAKTFIAQCLTDMNRTQEGIQVFDALLESEPNASLTRWQNARALPIIYSDVSEIRQFRARYAQGLLRVTASLDLSTMEKAREASDAIQDAFQLHYQGQNDRNLQELHGSLIHRIQNAKHPSFSANPIRRVTQPGEKIRIGFASSCFCNHTIAKLFGGWIAQLDREQFEVYCYSLGPTFDTFSQKIQQSADHFQRFGMNVTAAAHQATKDQLDVLIYPELGMDNLMLKMAALRLAPVQAVAWGHPITTGLPNVDYFLSSESMETAQGDLHYSEKLMRLPNLGLWLEPLHPPAPAKSRSDLGLPESGDLYLSCQSLFKILPQDDSLIVGIAASNPRARFAFISHPTEAVTAAFVNRLTDCFTAHDVPLGDRLHILPRLNTADYLCVNQLADVFLDNPSWSGGMTTLEALACGLVPVTLPGPMMRQRHTAAILKQIGVTDTIAKNNADYVEIAARLGRDSEFRHSLQTQIAQNRHRLYRDEAALSALEGFLQKAVHLSLRSAA
jgi:predicted O-linked N-acetylglucosamine transferase (SPINDLY family)